MTITDPEVQTSWQRDGYVILKRAVPLDLIDALNVRVAAFRGRCGETKDEHGFGQRIGLFHAHDEVSLAVALNSEVREFLTSNS